MLADADLQIAATAIVHGLELVTGNVKHSGLVRLNKTFDLRNADGGRRKHLIQEREKRILRIRIILDQKWSCQDRSNSSGEHQHLDSFVPE